MKISTLLLTAAASSVTQALRFTNANFYNITVGKQFNITWTDANGPVTLTLLKGASPAYFENMGVIASGLVDSFYVWTPNNTLLRDIYDIQFQDSTGVPINGFMFELVQAPITAVASTTTAAGAAATTTTYATTWVWPTRTIAVTTETLTVAPGRPTFTAPAPLTSAIPAEVGRICHLDAYADDFSAILFAASLYFGACQDGLC